MFARSLVQVDSLRPLICGSVALEAGRHFTRTHTKTFTSSSRDPRRSRSYLPPRSLSSPVRRSPPPHARPSPDPPSAPYQSLSTLTRNMNAKMCQKPSPWFQRSLEASFPGPQQIQQIHLPNPPFTVRTPVLFNSPSLLATPSSFPQGGFTSSSRTSVPRGTARP